MGRLKGPVNVSRGKAERGLNEMVGLYVKIENRSEEQRLYRHRLEQFLRDYRGEDFTNIGEVTPEELFAAKEAGVFDLPEKLLDEYRRMIQIEARKSMIHGKFLNQCSGHHLDADDRESRFRTRRKRKRQRSGERIYLIANRCPSSDALDENLLPDRYIS